MKSTNLEDMKRRMVMLNLFQHLALLILGFSGILSFHVAFCTFHFAVKDWAL